MHQPQEPDQQPPSKVERRRQARPTKVGTGDVRVIYPAAVACMRATPGFPPKIEYRHQFQGYDFPKHCRRCGVVKKKA